jgi:hypothetical protein
MQHDIIIASNFRSLLPIHVIVTAAVAARSKQLRRRSEIHEFAAREIKREAEAERDPFLDFPPAANRLSGVNRFIRAI